MAERWFLKIDGITGESTDVSHNGEIDVESWSWGLSQSGSPGSGGGGGAGKVSFQDFHFVGRISKASPALFLACASGSHIKTATLSGVRGAGKVKNAEFLKVKIMDALITSYLVGDSGDTVPTDQFSLNFSKVELSYTSQSAKGKAEPPVTASWDLKQSKKF